MIFEFSGSRPTSQFKNPKNFEFSRVRLVLRNSIKFPWKSRIFAQPSRSQKNRQIIQKISSMRKLLTNRVVPAQNFLAKIDNFSQKSVSFRKKLQIFAKKSYFSAKIGRFSQKNLQIFAKIWKFSQKFANFRKNRKIFAKNLQISQKICKFSQKSANFRKNRQILANICKFVIFEFSGSQPTSQFKNPKIFKFSRVRLVLRNSIKFP